MRLRANLGLSEKVMLIRYILAIKPYKTSTMRTNQISY